MAMHEVFHTLRLVYIIFRSCYVVEDALPIPIYLDTISLTEIYSCKEIRSSTFFFLELFLARHELLLKRDTLRKKNLRVQKEITGHVVGEKLARHD